jgi:chromosome segregation ATPase
MILRITSLEEEVETAHALKSEIGELKDVESELEQTREELAALTSSNSSLREAWESVSSELSDKVMSYEQAAMDARDREYNLQEELRRLTESAVLSESQLRSEIQTSSHNERNAREIALEAQRKNAEGFRKIAGLETELKQAIEKLNAVSQGGGAADHELQAKLKLAGQTINQLKRQKSEGSASMDQVRAEMGHKMQEIRQLKAALIQTRKELAAQLESQKRLSAALKQSKSQNVSVENAREREQLIARFEAKTTTLETENHRLRQIAQKSESGLVEFELKISTLENTIMERNRQVELLRSEVADKAERLKRFSERLDKL